MPAAPDQGSERRLPFAPHASMRTVWILASSWAPLVGLVMALADLAQERRTFLEGVEASWGIGPIFLVRLAIICAVARKASAARARWQAVAWLAVGGAVLVAMFVCAVRFPSDMRASETQEAWNVLIETPVALGAAWYGVLAASLYWRSGRTSHERQDYGVALAGLWIAVTAIVSHFALTKLGCNDPTRNALVRMTRALFGHGTGLGYWIYGDAGDDAILGLHLVLASGLPFAIALGSLLRILARRRWVHLVENERSPGWGLRDAAAPWPAGIPVMTGDERGPIKVLARLRDGGGPYRTSEAEPIALVATSPSPGSRRSR